MWNGVIIHLNMFKCEINFIMNYNFTNFDFQKLKLINKYSKLIYI